MNKTFVCLKIVPLAFIAFISRWHIVADSMWKRSFYQLCLIREMAIRETNNKECLLEEKGGVETLHSLLLVSLAINSLISHKWKNLFQNESTLIHYFEFLYPQQTVYLHLFLWVFYWWKHLQNSSFDMVWNCDIALYLAEWAPMLALVVSGWEICLWAAATVPFQLSLWCGMVNIVHLQLKFIFTTLWHAIVSLLTRSILLWLLLGYLKVQIFKCKLQTSDELKDFIHHKTTD